MRDHNVEALPVWAQDKIRYLTRDLEAAKAELIKRDANKKTHIVVNRYHDTPIYIPDEEEIAFMLYEEEFVEFRFERNREGNRVGVNVMSSGFRRDLAFLPSSGNTGRLLLVNSR